MVNMFCEHSELYSEVWPTWGMTRGGEAFSLPKPAPLTVASESSSPPTLPTPTTDDANNITRASGAFQSLARTVHQMLPSPAARDYKGAYPRHETECLPSAIAALE